MEMETETKVEMAEVVRAAEELVQAVMGTWDSSHDAFHALRVRKLALSLAAEEGLSSDSMEVVELAALLHDIGNEFLLVNIGKHCVIKVQGFECDAIQIKNRKNGISVEAFLKTHNVNIVTRQQILEIIKHMGFKEEIGSTLEHKHTPEFDVVQDADRLDAIGAIGIARCFTFGGSRNRVLHDPNVQPRTNISKEQYLQTNEKQTTLNHFYEKLLKLKSLMKTKAGQRKAEHRHNYLDEFLLEFSREWEGIC
ncbi:hypothetical protein O6H91_08G098700 [Diphasiastrum complanatum]|uniref:Uncharacterized protein n=1 Tax=Diphasiastrum complanatum TaxID=34168 RepID=A0ACC2D0Q5_DIPCM|nr:hypothetical protein O6H91_08G098700 [Diphasiastrum complanatum]